MLQNRKLALEQAHIVEHRRVWLKDEPGSLDLHRDFTMPSSVLLFL